VGGPVGTGGGAGGAGVAATAVAAGAAPGAAGAVATEDGAEPTGSGVGGGTLPAASGVEGDGGADNGGGATSGDGLALGGAGVGFSTAGGISASGDSITNPRGGPDGTGAGAAEDATVPALGGVGAAPEHACSTASAPSPRASAPAWARRSAPPPVCALARFGWNSMRTPLACGTAFHNARRSHFRGESGSRQRDCTVRPPSFAWRALVSGSAWRAFGPAALGSRFALTAGFYIVT
jgi:hypothetical protein